MIPNYFHTRLPFYESPFLTVQLEAQVSRKVSDKPYLNASANPNNWYPEFVFHRPWSTAEMTSFVIYSIDNDSVYATISLGSNPGTVLQEWQAIIDGRDRICTMFTGYMTSTTMPCGLYQYRIEYADGRKFYSEYFEVKNFKFNQQFFDGYTHIIYRSTCFFAEQHYSRFRNFYHHLWLPCEALYPEINVVEEKENDLSGNVLAQSHRYDKLQLLSIPAVSEPTLDAINSLVMYTTGENLECKVYSKNIIDKLINIIDVIPDKPDYSKNEIAPILKVRLQIDPSISDAACCDNSKVTSYCSTEDNPIQAPQPAVERILFISAKMTIGSTTGSNWFDLNKLPKNCFVRMFFRKVSDPGDVIYYPSSGAYSFSELALGKTITGLLPGEAYIAGIQIRAYGESCWSDESVGVEI